MLFGIDCRSPTEAELTPPTECSPISVTDYREELFLSLSSARQLAVEIIQEAQRKYMAYYDHKAKADRFRLGEWILIKLPHEESGKQRKLSRPWHGPYRIMKLTDTDVTAIKIYFPEDVTIKVHQNRVSPCPMGLPFGCYWYEEKHKCPSLPKWAFSLFQEQADSTELHQTPNNSVCEEQIQSDTTEQRYDTSESQSTVSGKNLNDSSQLSRATQSSNKK